MVVTDIKMYWHDLDQRSYDDSDYHDDADNHYIIKGESKCRGLIKNTCPARPRIFDEYSMVVWQAYSSV